MMVVLMNYLHILEEVVKKHKMDIEECTSVCDGLAKIAISVEQVFCHLSIEMFCDE